MNHSVIYYECRINLGSLDNESALADLALSYNFRITKGKTSADAFLTGRGTDYSELYERMNKLHDHLILAKYSVRRTKIEAVIYDVLYGIDAPPRKL